MIIPSPDPIAFSLFGFPIYWYGIVMACAIFVGVMVANFLFNKMNPDFKNDIILSISPMLIISGIIGARLYFCMINLSYYLVHPLQIFDIRQGGLSVHGALIFGILTLVIYVLKTRINLYKLLDCLACGTIIGQSIGRWGNYFNSEAYGIPVDGQSWGLFIPFSQRFEPYVGFELFHPAFLYESFLNFVGFVILLFLYKKYAKCCCGVVFFVYLIFYSLVRVVVEQIRIDSALNVGVIPIAQIISVILFLVGVIGLTILVVNKKAR